MNKNYVHVGNIIEQERVRRQAQISKGIVSEVYDHIEKAHNDDLNDNIEKSDNLTRFETDIQDLNKAETELLLHKIQRQLNADSESTLLKAMKSIAINHYNDIEKAGHGIYEDNAENRRLNRVGQEYGHAAQRKEPTNKQPKKQEEAGGGLQAHAAKASDEALKRAAADEKAKPEVREAAKKELANRGGNKKSSENRGVGNGDADLGDKAAKQIIDSAKDFYAHNGDYYGYDSLKDYIDSNDWADDVDTDEFEDGTEAMQYVAKSLKRLAQHNSDGEVNADGETTIHGKGVNYEFVSGIKKGDARKILQEAGFKNDMGSNNVSKVYLSNDGKSVKIDYDDKEGKTKTAEIAISSDKSETLNKLYGEFSKEMTAVFDNDEPGKLDKNTLSKNINAELKNFWDKNDTDNDSSDWREGAYQIYKKYSKNNPMSAEKFDHEFASKYQGASEGKKMSLYFSARESGGDESEAENYANTEYKAFIRHLNDPRMSRTKFEPIPFRK